MMRDTEEFGAPVPNEPALEFGQVMARMRRIRTRISEYNSVHKLTAPGVDIFFGSARFESADMLTRRRCPRAFQKGAHRHGRASQGARYSGP